MFQPWPEADQSPSDAPATRPLGPSPPPSVDIASFRPSSSRRPAVLTAAVVVLMALVVLAATLVARQADQQVSGPSPRVQRVSPVSPSSSHSIEFTAAKGTGRLVIRSHAWVTTGIRAPRSGSYLLVEVELICTEGTISYDPYLFQVFDASGRLYDVADYADPAGQLAAGILQVDGRARGSVSFDLPRGAVTLLMTDDTTQSVTALKIPD